MIIIVGLGNPGKKYEKTRHNLGFRVLDKFQRKNRDVHHFSNFKLVKKFNSLISEGIFDREKIILAKPQTFMNNSGKSVKKLISNIPARQRPEPQALADGQYLTSDIWVVHDDIDLPLGEIKISIGRGSAGHKGVQSIIDELGTKDFVRFRIGIRPQEKIRMGAFAFREAEGRASAIRMQRFVLQKFNKEEEKILKDVIERTCQAIGIAVREGIEKAMSKFNK